MSDHDWMIYYLAAVPWFFVGMIFTLLLNAVKVIPK